MKKKINGADILTKRSGLTIQEVIERKKTLERVVGQAIKEQLEAFEAETGVAISDVNARFPKSDEDQSNFFHCYIRWGH